ncbi:MAG: hypothetical protein H8E34_09915 [Bacteroidetes bacterium]|nr:hypothetical protein [Bacteroidota bacterium]MBL6942747.1 hypothetical protein [Bacteroidales bacterium]
MKTRELRSIVLLIVMLVAISSVAQFVTPVSSITGQAEVTTVDGKMYSGKLKNAIWGPTGMTSFKLLDESGVDMKLKAAEVEQLKIKVDGLAKMEIIAEQSSNIKKLAKSNFKEVVDREHIYWQRVKLPGKEKYLLLQLLNPGFDELLQVYEIPNAKSGELSVDGIGVSGGMATAYYVVKNGNTLKITKKQFKKEDFKLLFGDCKKMMDEVEPDFKEFALQVFLYDDICK